MCRGYYTRTVLAAYDVKDKKLVQRWIYDSGTTPGVGAYGQGNHNLSVGDENQDAAYGYELHDAKTGEIFWGDFTGGDNGRGLAADIDATHRGYEMWSAS